MKFFLLVFLPFFISSCKSIERQESEEFIEEIVYKSWVEDVPYEGLLKAMFICEKHPDFDRCSLVTTQIYDISISYNSCLHDQRSKLCKTIVDEIRQTSLYLYLPNTITLKLPSTPFFWTLPTDLLEAKSSLYEYRDETQSWLWGEVKYYALAIVIIGLVAILYICFKFCMKEIQQNIERKNAIKRARQYEEEQQALMQSQQEMRENLQRIEAEKTAEEQRQRKIAEERKAKLEATIAYEKQEKIAQEKAEVDAMFKDLFKVEK